MLGWRNATHQWTGYPQRTAAIADSGTALIAPRLETEFAANGVRRRIDLNERRKRCTDPDEAAANVYGTSCSLTGFDRGKNLARLAVYAIDSAVARVENPN